MELKKTTYILILFFLIYTMSCAQDSNSFSYQLNGHKLTENKQLIINFTHSLSSILQGFGNDYLMEENPVGIAYHFNHKPISLFYYTETDNIDSIYFSFYDNRKESKLFISELKLNSLTITNKISFDQMQELLTSLNFSFSIEDRTNYCYFELKNHEIIAIEYLKEDLSRPVSVQVEVRYPI